MIIFRLNTPHYPNPLWLRDVMRGGRHSCTVQENGGVVLLGEALTFAEAGRLAPGADALAWVDGSGFLVCALSAEVARAEAEQQEAAVREEARRQQQARARRARAERVNAAIKLPVDWFPAIKDTLSGLSAGSWGDGRTRRTVAHICLKATLEDGRLRRSAGDFLCTSASGSNGKRHVWLEEVEQDPAGHSYGAEVTCPSCLRMAASAAKRRASG